MLQKLVLHHSLILTLQCLSLADRVRIVVSLSDIQFHRNGTLQRKSSLESQTLLNLNMRSRFCHPVKRRIGEWSEVILGSALKLQSRKIWSNSVEMKNLSSLAKVGLSCIFDQVMTWFDSGRSITSRVLVRSENMIIDFLLHELPFLFDWFLVRLKSPQITQLLEQIS